MTALGNGRIWLGAILAGSLLWGCSPALRGFDSTARTIRLREAPVEVPCWIGNRPHDCIAVLKQDWQTVVISYEAMCLQLGGSAVNCHTQVETTTP